ncbi:PAS domain S-box protein [Myxococcota bacterium]|nr:PAS domain S-box protein [Myxococcota bacterium]
MDPKAEVRSGQLARARVVLIVVVSSGFVFALDQITGDDVACGVLYTPLVLLGLWFRERWYLSGITAWSSLLIAASALPVAWRTRDLPDYNHLLALLAIWGCAWAVSRYQRTERSLSHVRSTRELYFDMAGGIIVALDRDGRITRMNRAGCDLLGWVEDELVTRSWLDVAVPDSDHAPYRALFEGLGRGVLALEPHVGLVRTRSGELRHVAWQHTLIRDETGAVTGALGSGLDVTARRKAEQALAEQKALAQIGQLAALVAHEVRNAVAGIGGALQVISERLPVGSAEREITKSVVDRTGALHRMVDDLLLYAKPRPQHVARASLAGIVRAARVHFGRI